jgi:MoxR-like ATPase
MAAENSTAIYTNFDLTIGSLNTDGAYTLTARLSNEPPEAETRIPADRLRYLGEGDDPARSGMMLSEAVFSGGVAEIFARARDQASSATQGRLRFRFAQSDPFDLDLQRIPWERLIAPGGSPEAPLSAAQETPFMRYQPPADPGQPPPISGHPLRLLAVVENSGRFGRYASVEGNDAAGEIDRLHAALAPHTRSGALAVTVWTPGGPVDEKLVGLLAGDGFTLTYDPLAPESLDRFVGNHPLLHYASLGLPAVDSVEESTAQYTQQARKAQTEPSFLAMLLTLSVAPPLIVLSADLGRQRSYPLASPYAEIGPQLISRRARAVIALHTIQGLNLAQAAAEEIYAGILETGIVDLTLNRARQTVLKLEPRAPLPILWSSAPDGQILAPADERRSAAAGYPGGGTSLGDAATTPGGQVDVDEARGVATIGGVELPINSPEGRRARQRAGLREPPQGEITLAVALPTPTPPGATLPVTLRVLNKGANPWPDDVEIGWRIIPSGADAASAGIQSAPADAAVAGLPAGEERTVTLTLTAPQPGDYTVVWSLYQGSQPVTTVMGASTLLGVRAPAGAGQAGAGQAVGGGATVFNINTLQVDLTAYEPPDKRIIIEVSQAQVKLRDDNQTYLSAPVWDHPALLEAQLKPRLYGELLFASLMRSEQLVVGQESTDFGFRSLATPAAGHLRFELLLDPTAPDELHDLAWEYLAPPAGKYAADLPLAVRERSPFYRRLNYQTRLLQVEGGVLRVLVAICSPPQLGDLNNELLGPLAPLDLDVEKNVADLALQRLADAQVVEYKVIGLPGKPATLRSITEALQAGAYHVLHLVCHGVFTKRLPPDNYYLVMERDDGKLPFVSVEEMKTVVEAGDVRMVVLAACNSAKAQSGGALRGLGARLILQGAPAVVAMQNFVPIETAQYFTQHFYDDLARSGRVDMAMAATRLALYQRNPASLDWGMPVLFMGSYQQDDYGRLLTVSAGDGRSIPKLRPDIRTYQQLGGKENPVARSIAQALQADAQALGALQVAGALQRAVSAATGGPTGLATSQDRDALSAGLTTTGRVDATQLRLAISEGKWLDGNGVAHERSGARLELPESAYFQIAAALNSGKHVVLIGPPGTGKTTLAHALCEYARSQLLCTGATVATATADWTTFDTVGGYTPTADQTLQFRPGSFLEAIGKGEWLVIDEINRAEIDKAFGELFTVLSGQRVDLPYTVSSQRVRILPPDTKNGGKGWIPREAAAAGFDYVVHPAWRIVATMNVYDKASLFSMSLAFMRRFAFVDTDLPPNYAGLRNRWIDENASLQGAGDKGDLTTALDALLDLKTTLMKRRALGPAIVRDMIAYVGERYPARGGLAMADLLAEAFLLYAASQFDGLDRKSIVAIHKELAAGLGPAAAQRGVLSRIEALYPFIDDWESEE